MTFSCARYGAVATLMLLKTTAANVVNVVNHCDHVIEFSHSAAGRVENVTQISVGSSLSLTNVTGPTHMFRHTTAINTTGRRTVCRTLDLACSHHHLHEQSLTSRSTATARGSTSALSLPMYVAPVTGV